MSVNILSEIDLLLSNVNVEMSEVCSRMSSVPVQSRFSYLPRIGILLTTLESLVSSSGMSSTESSLNMSWDSNHDYYMYSEEENTKYELCDEEFFIDLPACDEERVIDSPACDEECAIDSPACDEERVIDPLAYDALSPAAEEVTMLFPAAKVFKMFLTISDTVSTDNTSTTSTRSSYTTMTTSTRSSYTESEMSSNLTSDSNTTVEWITEYYKEEAEDDITTRLIKFIDIAAPGDVFSIAKSRRRRRRKMMKFVHPELRMIFQHSLDLFSPVPSTPVAAPRPRVPIVEWSKVNQRNLGNLPTPQMFPKLGCSDDPNIYAERTHDRGAHGLIPIGTLHQKPFPFGGEFGLMIDLGVISTNKGDHMEDPYLNIVHGHVWSRELRCWVIYAKYPKDNITKSVKEGAKIFRKPKKKVESR